MKVECQIAEFVNYKKFGFIQLAIKFHEASSVLSFNQRVSKICCSVEINLHAQVAGLDSECNGQMCFADTGISEHYYVFAIIDKVTYCQFINISFTQVFKSVQIKLIKSFQIWKMSRFNEPLSCCSLPSIYLTIE